MGKTVSKFQTCQSPWTGTGGFGQIFEATHPLSGHPLGALRIPRTHGQRKLWTAASWGLGKNWIC